MFQIDGWVLFIAEDGAEQRKTEQVSCLIQEVKEKDFRIFKEHHINNKYLRKQIKFINN